MPRAVHWLAPGLALAALASWGWIRHRRAQGAPEFMVEPVRRHALRDSVAANGELQARTRVNVGVQVTAAIRRIHVHDGQWVKAGDLLVTLERERYRQAVTQAETGLRMAEKGRESAQSALAKEEGSYRRQDTLHGHGLNSAEDFQKARLARDQAATALDKARAAVRQAQAQVAIAQDDLAKTVIRASMAGQVTGLKAEQGETAIAGTTNLSGAVLMVISDLSEMMAELRVGELDVVKVRVGQSAEITVDALPSKVFRGRVASVATSPERPETGSAMLGGGMEAQGYKVRVLLDTPHGQPSPFRPGLSARVAILTAEHPAVLTIPLAAIQERETAPEGLGLLNGTRSVVFVARDGHAREREIRTDLATRQEAEVVSGLQEGEQVITGPTKFLSTLVDGMRVKLQGLP